MKAFVDTSTLAKKYKENEPGREQFFEILEEVNQIIVSPVTYIELICLIKRYFEDFKQKPSHLKKLKKEIDLDFGYFHEVSMDDNLKNIAYGLRQKHMVKSLDLIQLSAAKISNAQIIITSDKHLYKIASKELKNVQLVI